MSNANRSRRVRDARIAGNARAARLSDDAIIDRIMRAIVEHRLPPGTKLGEDRLGEAFGVSRTRVRQVLLRLAADKVVTQIANRGAFVAQPSIEEARAVFEARRIIEGDLAARAASARREDDVRRLRGHLARERKAERAGDVRAMIKLSGEFHQIIAGMAGNTVLADVLRELVARSSLILALYGPPRARDCANADHDALLAAIRRRDSRAAASLMREHLGHLEAEFALPAGYGTTIDLEAVLGSHPVEGRATGVPAAGGGRRRTAPRAAQSGGRR